MHEVVEIVILFMVGFLFRPRLLATFSHIEVDRAEALRHGRRAKSPPLYLIPVAADEYDAVVEPAETSAAAPAALADLDLASSGSTASLGSGPEAVPELARSPSSSLIIPRKDLSPSDLLFTLSASAGSRRRRRRRQHSRGASTQLHQQEGRGGHGRTPSGAGRVESEEQEQARRLQRLLREREEDEEGRGAAMHEMIKPVLAYHASRFLVVALPDGTHAVAVSEEDEARAQSEQEEDEEERTGDQEIVEGL